jgi:hypothetical protein
MKITKLLLCATVAGAMAFAASKVSAFPLKLAAITGTISATPNYSPLYSTNKTQYITAAVTMQQIMLIVSNTVTTYNHANSITNPVPKDAYIAWDPAYGSDYGYLTNSSGYFEDLNGPDVCYFYVEYIATSFNGNSVSGNFTESDKIVFYADIYGYGPDGLYYEFYNDYGTGVLTYAVTQGGSKGTMTIYSEGGGYGALKSSDEGESDGKLLFTGTGTPSFSGPYSLWYYD